MMLILPMMAALLFIAVIVGLGFFVQEDPAASEVGKYILIVSLAMMALQVLLGLGMRIVSRFKK